MCKLFGTFLYTNLDKIIENRNCFKNNKTLLCTLMGYDKMNKTRRALTIFHSSSCVKLLENVLLVAFTDCLHLGL